MTSYPYCFYPEGKPEQAQTIAASCLRVALQHYVDIHPQVTRVHHMRGNDDIVVYDHVPAIIVSMKR